jgi:hypothetical protein
LSLSLVDITRLRRAGVPFELPPGEVIQSRMSRCGLFVLSLICLVVADIDNLALYCDMYDLSALLNRRYMSWLYLQPLLVSLAVGNLHHSF